MGVMMVAVVVAFAVAVAVVVVVRLWLRLCASVISCDRDCGCGWLRLRFVVGMVVGVIAFVTVHALLWERSTRIELCYRPLNPRGGGRRTKPCDHTAL